MRVAVVGAGIAGLTAAYRLSPRHEVTVYDRAPYVGGHTYTVNAGSASRPVPVDLGFIVLNDWTYPRFGNLLSELGVATQPAPMTFSVHCESTGFEYNGTTINSLLAQRRNALRPWFWGFVADILRFNRESPKLLGENADCAGLTLGEYLADNRYGRAFRQYYLLPMGQAIWSATERALLGFPARFFVDFFKHHGLLSIDERPQWRSVVGGSSRYVEKLCAATRARFVTDSPVTGIRRLSDRVVLRERNGSLQHFDYVILACHADQALGLLNDPTTAEVEVLRSFEYQDNDVVLHSDSRWLPRTPRARAAWNYRRTRAGSERAVVTYDMRVLQSIRHPRPLLVTLNHAEHIEPAAILDSTSFRHPVYSPRAVGAQRRRSDISGVNRTGFAGAYWRYGFHEDGCVSGEWAALEAERAIPTTAREAGHGAIRPRAEPRPEREALLE